MKSEVVATFVLPAASVATPSAIERNTFPGALPAPVALTTLNV